MLDDFDLGPSGTEGTRWMRIVSGLVGLLVGAALGYFYAQVAGAAGLAAVGYTVVGALAGGLLGAIFSFYVIVGIAIVVAVVGTLAFQWYFGGA